MTYEFNGKRTSASSRSSDFARVAEKPGEFSVLSVAHQQNKCRSNVSGLTKHLHDLPSCRISEGKHFIEDLREGAGFPF